MIFKHLQKKRHMRSIISTALFVLLLGYFTFHAISGERGLLALIKLSRQVEDKKQELELLRAERLHLEHRVELLKPESLDLDMLDEQSRRVLGYAAPDENVYLPEKQ